MIKLFEFIVKFMCLFLLVYAIVRYPNHVRAIQELMFGWFINIIAPIANKIYTTIINI